MTDQHSTESVPVTLARLEGKLDAALIEQRGVAREHGRRLDTLDERVASQGKQLDEHTRALAAIPPPVPTQKASGWTIAGTITGAVVGLGSLLAVLITLIRVIPDAVG